MKNTLLHTAILFALSFGLAFASDKLAGPAMPVATGTQAQLDELNAENALLTVELKNVELKNKIKNGGQSNQTPSPIPGLPAPAMPGIKSKPAYDDAADAKVVLVSGAPGHAIATILLDGAQIKASEGMTVSGLGTVMAITLDEVVVKHGKRVFALPFVADITSAPVGAGMNGGMRGGMPPMPNGSIGALLGGIHP